MRVVGIVIAALITLGLAAFGLVAAQRTAISGTAAVIVAHQAIAPKATAAIPTPVVATAAVVAPEQNVAPAPIAPEAAAPRQVAEPAAPLHVAETIPVTTPAQLTEKPAELTDSRPFAAPILPAVQREPAHLAPTLVADNVPAQTAQANQLPSAAAPPASAAIPKCDKPGGMGLERIVQIDTTGGPGFGFEHFKQYDFLREKEVVLTFDDGPWPENTQAVLKALADNCLKATFFEIGEHAMWHPELSKEVAQAGMTIGTHTWSHKDLAKNPYASDIEQAKQEIEMGFSAVHKAVDGPIAPFFRFPDLQHPPALLSYLGERNIAVFSTDIDSFDFKLHKPEQVIKSVMTKLQKHGKGIILMHDFQRGTAEAMPELLRQLKAGGYKVVHLVPKAPVTTIAKYDEMVLQQDKLSVNNTRPENSVIKTIEGN